MRDGDVLEGDVELGGAAGEVGADALGDSLALGDELGGVELGDDGFEDFVADGGENTLVVVGAEVLRMLALMLPAAYGGTSSHLVNLWQRRDVRPVQDSQRQADHLKILATGGCSDIPGLGAHIEDDGPLQPWHEEVSALVDDILLHTGNTIEDDGSTSTLDIVESRVDGDGTDRKGDRQAVNGLEEPRCVRHRCGYDVRRTGEVEGDAGGKLRIEWRGSSNVYEMHLSSLPLGISGAVLGDSRVVVAAGRAKPYRCSTRLPSTDPEKSCCVSLSVNHHLTF